MTDGRKHQLYRPPTGALKMCYKHNAILTNWVSKECKYNLLCDIIFTPYNTRIIGTKFVSQLIKYVETIISMLINLYPGPGFFAPTPISKKKSCDRYLPTNHVADVI